MTDAYAPEAGDIVWTDFDPRTGREQGGRRPVLVVSPLAFYQAARLLIVCPVTSRIRPFKSSVVLPDGFPIKGEILISHVRSLDALASPLHFSGVSAPAETLAAVRGNLATLCGITLGDLGAP